MLEERQKLIRLANRSEHGWSVVDEYTVDDHTKDLDDEQRIEKAEKAAKRAAKRKAGKRHKGRSLQTGQARPRGGPGRFPAAGIQQPVMGISVPAVPVSQPRRQGVPLANRPVGPCHFCGEMGHLRLYCPPRAAATNSNWYPFQVEHDTGVDLLYKENVCEGANGRMLLMGNPTGAAGSTVTLQRVLIRLGPS